MTTITNRITAAATIALGSAALAFGAAATAPVASAATFQETCINNPGAFATGATRGVYSTEKRGFDRYEICKVYSPAGALLGSVNVPNYNFYKMVEPVRPPLSVSQPPQPTPSPSPQPPLSVWK